MTKPPLYEEKTAVSQKDVCSFVARNKTAGHSARSPTAPPSFRRPSEEAENKIPSYIFPFYVTRHPFFFLFISQLVRLLHREHQHPSGWKKDTVWHEPFGECPFVHFSFFFLFNRTISNTQKEKHPSSLEHFFSTVSTTKRRNRKIQHTPKYRSYAHFFFKMAIGISYVQHVKKIHT